MPPLTPAIQNLVRAVRFELTSYRVRAECYFHMSFARLVRARGYDPRPFGL